VRDHSTNLPVKINCQQVRWDALNIISESLVQGCHPSRPLRFCSWCRGWDLKPQQACIIANSHLSVASFPLFLFGEDFLVAEQSLAGDDLHEKKNSQLSSLRQNTGKRLSRRSSEKKSKMSNMWQPEELEIWSNQDTKWESSTLLMQRLRQSIFRALNPPLFLPFQGGF
jgi:hypothetical protein